VAGIEEREKWFETFVNLGIVKRESSSPGSKCKSRKCWVQNVYHGSVGCKMYIKENGA
jgi:hypothetical protein